MKRDGDNFTRDAHDIYSRYEFENYWIKITAPSSRANEWTSVLWGVISKYIYGWNLFPLIFVHIYLNASMYNISVNISTAECKTAVIPLLTQWGYCSLALSRYGLWSKFVSPLQNPSTGNIGGNQSTAKRNSGGVLYIVSYREIWSKLFHNTKSYHRIKITVIPMSLHSTFIPYMTELPSRYTSSYGFDCLTGH